MSQFSNAPRKSSGLVTSRHPSPIRCRASLRRSGCRRPRFIRLDLDAKVIGREVIADGSGLIFHGAEQDFGALQIPHRSLRVDVEFAQRFNVIAEKLRANRPLGLPRKQIENPAADRELPARGDLGDPFVTGPDECFNRSLQGLALPATKRQDRRA